MIDALWSHLRADLLSEKGYDGAIAWLLDRASDLRLAQAEKDTRARQSPDYGNDVKALQQRVQEAVK